MVMVVTPPPRVGERDNEGGIFFAFNKQRSQQGKRKQKRQTEKSSEPLNPRVGKHIRNQTQHPGCLVRGIQAGSRRGVKGPHLVTGMLQPRSGFFRKIQKIQFCIKGFGVPKCGK